jgi:hypothetical protein
MFSHAGRLAHAIATRLGFHRTVARLIFGQKIAAVMELTWKAAFRFRLFVVITALLLAAVVALPILIKDDGTARGFTQILLTYTLSSITGLLGVSTLWLSCGTLARDIEECQLQVVAVKPIARWQIWLGKWLGIMSINAALLAISGLSIFLLLQWRATKLPIEERKILENEILVARGSAKPADAKPDIDAATEALLLQRLSKTSTADLNPAQVQQRLQQLLNEMGPAQVKELNLPEIRKQLRQQVKSSFEEVPPGYTRQWQVDLGLAKYFLRGRPLQMRIKFNSADKSPSGTFQAVWRFGVPPRLAQSSIMSLAPETFHEFPIPADLLDENGVLTINFMNVLNNTTLLFPVDEGIEVLYREGSFGPNFARGLGIIFCWMGLLAAIGLFGASFLSFPVAAFFALGILMVVFSSKTLENAVEEGTAGEYNQENGTVKGLFLDRVAMPCFKATLFVINIPRQFSPVDSLSTGRSVTWPELGKAAGEVVVLFGGIFALTGMVILTRRELATAQGTQ